MGIDSTLQSGLSDATTYYFKVNDVEYSITTGTGPTFQDVANLLDTALDAAGFNVYIIPASNNEGGEDIRVYNEGVRGSGSVCVLDHGDTSPDLFNSLSFWSRFRKETVYGFERPQDLYVIERDMTGKIRIRGGADWDIPVFENTFYHDTYYKDEYYTGD